MDFSFAYSRERQFYALRFRPGAFETVPFLQELRFWGVDRFPCPRLSTLAALIALQDHPLESVTLSHPDVNGPISRALSEHFGVPIHNKKLDSSRRDLAGGDVMVAPSRGVALDRALPGLRDAERLTWISLDDIGQPMTGLVRTNIDAFDLSESAKNLIVGLCCAGKEVGHIAVADADPGMADILNWIGLELIDLAAEG